MDMEKEQLKLRLLEAQSQILHYQHREISASMQAFQAGLVTPIKDVAGLDAIIGS